MCTLLLLQDWNMMCFCLCCFCKPTNTSSCPCVLQKPKERATPPSVPLPSPTVKVEDSAAETSCSQLTQSCVPQFGCCDPQALCHCRFFNAICFCRRLNRGH